MLLGPRYPAPRTFEERIEARRSLTERYPDSPDAWYFLGDYYMHFGRAIAPTQFLAIARAALERSAAIDSQATVLNHLVWIGIQTDDTLLLRRAMPALDRTDDATKWMAGWLAAATTGDAARLAALRRRPVDHAADPGAIQAAFIAAGAAVTPALLDEMFDRWVRAIPVESGRQVIQAFHGQAMALAGRPSAAERVWGGLTMTPAAPLDELRLSLALTGDAAGLDVAGAVRRLADHSTTDSTSRGACLLELWRRDHGEAARVDPERFRTEQPRCARALEVASLGWSAAADAEGRLAALDSAVHHTFPSTADAEQVEGPILARAWERRGNARRALAAVRRNVSAVVGLREEGRLGALAGDTAGALYAYRMWLRLTQVAEPVLQPARDSVRAEVARLTTR